MMLYHVFSVRDRSADAYGRPFFHTSKGGAIRSFSDEINGSGPDNVLAKHPEDFDLFYLGTFSDDRGEFVTVRPEQIAVGKDLVTPR